MGKRAIGFENTNKRPKKRASADCDECKKPAAGRNMLTCTYCHREVGHSRCLPKHYTICAPWAVV